MKKKLLTTLLIVVTIQLSAQDKLIANFNQVLEKANHESKEILIVFSGSDWCANCIKFKKNILEAESFKDYSEGELMIYIADFPRKVKLSKEQKEQNITLFNKFNKKGVFPFVVLLNAKGELVKQIDTSYNIPENFINQFIDEH